MAVQNIPARALIQKKRNYLSPEAIQAALELSSADPQLFAHWKHHVPLNLQEIRRSLAAAH